MDNVGNCLTDKKYLWHVEIYDKDDINARDFVDNFPTNFLRSITFLHPVSVCGWTFHRTAKPIESHNSFLSGEDAGNPRAPQIEKGRVHQEKVASSSRQSQPRARQDRARGQEGCVMQCWPSSPCSNSMQMCIRVSNLAQPHHNQCNVPH